jgi:hypothetical protein
MNEPMPLDPARCPADPEEVAEAYCMGTLPLADTAAFGQHYIACSRCAAVVEATDQYVRAMRTAATRLRPGGGTAGE